MVHALFRYIIEGIKFESPNFKLMLIVILPPSFNMEKETL